MTGGDAIASSVYCQLIKLLLLSTVLVTDSVQIQSKKTTMTTPRNVRRGKAALLPRVRFKFRFAGALQVLMNTWRLFGNHSFTQHLCKYGQNISFYCFHQHF